MVSVVSQQSHHCASVIAVFSRTEVPVMGETEMWLYLGQRSMFMIFIQTIGFRAGLVSPSLMGRARIRRRPERPINRIDYNNGQDYVWPTRQCS